MQKKRTTKSRKPGGQPGNKNAEKHGFYSRHFSTDETSRLADADTFSVENEIQLLRVYVSRISELVPLDTELQDMDIKALNTLGIMSATIATLIRTNFLTKGKGGAVEQSILEALEEIRLEMGL